MGPQDDVSLSFDTNPNLTFPQHRRPQGANQQQPMQFQPPPGMGPGPGLGSGPGFGPGLGSGPGSGFGPAAGGPPGGNMAFMSFDMSKPSECISGLCLQRGRANCGGDITSKPMTETLGAFGGTTLITLNHARYSTIVTIRFPLLVSRTPFLVPCALPFAYCFLLNTVLLSTVAARTRGLVDALCPTLFAPRSLKTASALNPIRINIDLYDDGDLSGPLIFCVLFGLCQLMGSTMGTCRARSSSACSSALPARGMSSQAGLDLYRCCSIFGYGMLPMVLYSAVSIFFPRREVITAVAAAVAIVWCTRIAASAIATQANAAAHSKPSYWLYVPWVRTTGGCSQ
ncbi:unnamed protein product [Closterium sp. NIES-54]